MRTLRKILLCFTALAAGGGLWAAEEMAAGGGYSMPLGREGFGARATALGGAPYVGLAEGATALSWNPAGLAFLSSPEVALHHKSAFNNSSVQESAVLGIPMGRAGGLGLSFSYLDAGSFEGRDASGSLTGEYQARNYSGSLGWGLGGPEMQGVSLGIAGKFNRQDLAGQSYDSLSGDLGALWRLHPYLALGVSYVNWGPSVAGLPLATALRVGASSHVVDAPDYRWLVAVAGEFRGEGDQSLHVGLENTLMRFLALRAGYASDLGQAAGASTSALNGWTFGAGFLIGMDGALGLDYAFVPQSELGNSHRASLSFRFGQPDDSALLSGESSPEAGAMSARDADRVIVLIDADFEDRGDGSELLGRDAQRAMDAYLDLGGEAQGPLRVEGRSVSLRSTEQLRELGRLRAALVRDYLLSKGVPGARINVLPSGASPAPDGTGKGMNIFQVVLR